MRFTSISSRLYGLVALGAVGLIAMAVVASWQLHRFLLDERTALSHHMTELALGSVKAIYERSQKGEISEAEAKDAARRMLRNFHYGNNEYFFAYDFDGVNIAHGRDPSQEGNNMLGLVDSRGQHHIADLIETARKGGGTTHYWVARTGADQPMEKISYTVPFAPWNWEIGTGVYIDDLEQTQGTQLKRLAAAAALLILLTAGAAALFSRHIGRSVEALRHDMEMMACGHLDTVVEAARQGGEIGRMGVTLDGFRNSLLKARELAAEQERAKSQAAELRARELRELTEKFQNMAGMLSSHVRDTATDLLECATGMNDLVHDGAGRTSAITEASAQAASTVGIVAAATEELSASINEIAQLVQRSSQGAEAAFAKAQRSNELIRGLADTAMKINDVVELITSIAAQTNLLALNATIEAARAGEAGKGFAVVAGEVKNLANQTARATGDITAQIKAVQTESQNAAAAIEEIVGAIRVITEAATAVSGAVVQQDAATREIAQNIQIASTNTAEVSAKIGGIVEVNYRTGQSTKELVVAAHIMAGLATDMEQKVQEFGNIVHKQ